MSRIFDEILYAGFKADKIPGKTADARKWYREKAKDFGRVNESAFFKDVSPNEYKSQAFPGRMYMFYYDPKHKDTLPYYDRVPLVFPVDKAPGGFYGLNLHYLPLKERAILMDALYETINNKRYDNTTKLKLSYQTLISASKYKLFKPAFKRYLTAHVRSRFVHIAPVEWDIALWMDVAKFEKASAKKVWDDSRNIIKANK
jgi:hypothetical protein